MIGFKSTSFVLCVFILLHFVLPEKITFRFIRASHFVLPDLIRKIKSQLCIFFLMSILLISFKKKINICHIKNILYICNMFQIGMNKT